MSINVSVSGGTGIDAAPETTVEVTSGIGPAAFVNNLGEIVGVQPFAAGNGITLTTTSGSIVISSRSDSDVSNLSLVKSVNTYTGDITLTVQDLTAASAVHTHVIGDVTGLQAALNDTVSNSNLSDLSDVSGNAATAGQALTWDGSQWEAANVPVGTTINGLSGNVSLVGGENVLLSSSGQSITISSPERVGTTAKNLRITRNALGELHLEWDAPLGYVGEYLVDVTPVGIEANVTATSAVSLAADGSLTASVSIDSGVSLDRVVLFAANGSEPVSAATDFYPTTGDIEIVGNNATISNAYLPDEFTAPGPVHLLVAAYDISGFPFGASDVTTLNVTQHGSPVAPDIALVSVGNGTVDLSLFSTQTPHQRGFYEFSQIAYFAEINENENATTGWVRGNGVTADRSDTLSDLTLASVDASEGTAYYARVVAANPLGEGEARKA